MHHKEILSTTDGRFHGCVNGSKDCFTRSEQDRGKCYVRTFTSCGLALSVVLEAPRTVVRVLVRHDQTLLFERPGYDR